MGTEKQEKHTVNITFLFISEGHKTIWEPWILFFWTSGFLTRPDTNSHKLNLVWQFFPSSLELSHKARCWLTKAQYGLRLLPQFLGPFSKGKISTHTGKSHCWLWQFLFFYFLNVAIPMWLWLQKFYKNLIVFGDRSILHKKWQDQL
jgi:hypothetical protein